MPEKSLELGRVDGVPLIIAKDGKYDDRYFLRLGLNEGYLRFAPSAEQSEDLVRAVESLAADCESD